MDNFKINFMVKEAESTINSLVTELLAIWKQYWGTPDNYNKERAIEIIEDLEPWRDILADTIVDRIENYGCVTTYTAAQIMDILKNTAYENPFKPKMSSMLGLDDKLFNLQILHSQLTSHEEHDTYLRIARYVALYNKGAALVSELDQHRKELACESDFEAMRKVFMD